MTAVLNRPFCATCIASDRELTRHVIDARVLLLCGRCSGADDLIADLDSHLPRGAPLLSAVAEVVSSLGEAKARDVAARLGVVGRRADVIVHKTLSRLVDAGALAVVPGTGGSRWYPKVYRVARSA